MHRCPHRCGHHCRHSRRRAAHDLPQYPLHFRPLNRRGGSDEPSSPATISRTLMHQAWPSRPPGAALGLTPHASLMLALPCASLPCALRHYCRLRPPRCCWTERMSHRYTLPVMTPARTRLRMSRTDTRTDTRPSFGVTRQPGARGGVCRKRYTPRSGPFRVSRGLIADRTTPPPCRTVPDRAAQTP